MTIEDLQNQITKLAQLIRRHLHDGTETEKLSSTFTQSTPTTEKGDLIVNNGVSDVRLPVGADGYVLSADSNEETGLKWVSPLTSLFTGLVKVLVVGGGGGGAGEYGGGGAGGEVRYDASHQVISHIGSPQAYPITIGAGGLGDFGNGLRGENSNFHNITSVGGAGASVQVGGIGTNGGGSGGNGNSSGVGGNGTNGTANSISGSAVTYGGGGAGYGSGGSGAGGAGGGGSGVGGGGANVGGAGSGGTLANPGGSGGKGLIIIRYITADFGPCTGGTITTDGADTIHTFTSNGTFTVVGI